MKRLLLAVVLILILPASAQAFSWLPLDDGYNQSANAAFNAQGGFQFTMHMAGGQVQSSAGAMGDTVMYQPAQGRAWCLKARMRWSPVPGTVATVWLRPNDYQVNDRPEFDFIEAIRVPFTASVVSHHYQPPGEPRAVGAETQAPITGRHWTTFSSRLTRSTFTWRVNGTLYVKGNLDWPASGYRPWAHYWAYTEPNWTGRQLPNVNRTAKMRVRYYSQRDCRA
jgi:hypothetical protein